MVAPSKKARMREHHFGEMAVSPKALLPFNESTLAIISLLIHFRYVAASEFPN